MCLASTWPRLYASGIVHALSGSPPVTHTTTLASKIGEKWYIQNHSAMVAQTATVIETSRLPQLAMHLAGCQRCATSSAGGVNQRLALAGNVSFGATSSFKGHFPVAIVSSPGMLCTLTLLAHGMRLTQVGIQHHFECYSGSLTDCCTRNVAWFRKHSVKSSDVWYNMFVPIPD